MAKTRDLSEAQYDRQARALGFTVGILGLHCAKSGGLYGFVWCDARKKMDRRATLARAVKSRAERMEQLAKARRK